MLVSTNPGTNPKVIRSAFLKSDIDRKFKKNTQIDYEHGQWWVTDITSGAQWSVHDTDKGLDFDQVSEGL